MNNKKNLSISGDSKAPCRDCKDRHPACHDNCKRYATFKAEIEKVRSAKEKQRMKEGWPPYVKAKKHKRP